MGSNNVNNGVIAKGKLGKEPIFDLAFTQNDEKLIIGGYKEVSFCIIENDSIIKIKGVWLSDLYPYSALCVDSIITNQEEEFAVATHFDGKISLWEINTGI
jgi:hypothetical protein